MYSRWTSQRIIFSLFREITQFLRSGTKSPIPFHSLFGSRCSFMKKKCWEHKVNSVFLFQEPGMGQVKYWFVVRMVARQSHEHIISSAWLLGFPFVVLSRNSGIHLSHSPNQPLFQLRKEIYWVCLARHSAWQTPWSPLLSLCCPGSSPSPPLTALFWVLASAHGADQMLSSILPSKILGPRADITAFSFLCKCHRKCPALEEKWRSQMWWGRSTQVEGRMMLTNHSSRIC